MAKACFQLIFFNWVKYDKCLTKQWYMFSPICNYIYELWNYPPRIQEIFCHEFIHIKTILEIFSYPSLLNAVRMSWNFWMEILFSFFYDEVYCNVRCNSSRWGDTKLQLSLSLIERLSRPAAPSAERHFTFPKGCLFNDR